MGYCIDGAPSDGVPGKSLKAIIFPSRGSWLVSRKRLSRENEISSSLIACFSSQNYIRCRRLLRPYVLWNEMNRNEEDSSSWSPISQILSDFFLEKIFFVPFSKLQYILNPKSQVRSHIGPMCLRMIRWMALGLKWFLLQYCSSSLQIHFTSTISTLRYSAVSERKKKPERHSDSQWPCPSWKIHGTANAKLERVWPGPFNIVCPLLSLANKSAYMVTLPLYGRPLVHAFKRKRRE